MATQHLHKSPWSCNDFSLLISAGRAQFVGIELYSHLKDYLEAHLNQIQPVCYFLVYIYDLYM